MKTMVVFLRLITNMRFAFANVLHVFFIASFIAIDYRMMNYLLILKYVSVRLNLFINNLLMSCKKHMQNTYQRITIFF